MQCVNKQLLMLDLLDTEEDSEEPVGELQPALQQMEFSKLHSMALLQSKPLRQ